MSDIDTAVADSLKVLDLKRPIREADIDRSDDHISFGPPAELDDLRGGPHEHRVASPQNVGGSDGDSP